VPREKLVSRVTKHIRLVLISSSLLALPGCGGRDEATCETPPGRDPNMPPVCGPVDGRMSGYHGVHYDGRHGFVPSQDSTSWGRGGSTGARSGGRSSFTGSARGGFGGSFHGVGS
jgi:hypothetical protein